MRIVITTDGATKDRVITSFRALRETYPRTSWVQPVTQEHLTSASQGRAFLSQEVARPVLAYGQDATTDDERQRDGTWRQVWTGTRITLAEAKAQLRDEAVRVYKAKVWAVSASELLSENGLVGAMQARDTRFLPSLVSVANRIQSASTIDDAKVR